MCAHMLHCGNLIFCLYKKPEIYPVGMMALYFHLDHVYEICGVICIYLQAMLLFLFWMTWCHPLMLCMFCWLLRSIGQTQWSLGLHIKHLLQYITRVHPWRQNVECLFWYHSFTLCWHMDCHTQIDRISLSPMNMRTIKTVHQNGLALIHVMWVNPNFFTVLP